MSDSQYTPLIQQFLDIKSRHEDSLLFFRVGDFYEMFFEDAKVGSQALGITLTSRNNGNEDIPLAGIPVKAVDEYLPELLRQGYRVAICEQTEEASQAQGLVDREVIEIITPGTVLEDSLLDSKRNNFVAAVVGEDPVGMGWVDLSTGEFGLREVPRDALLDELQRIEPTEVVVPSNAETDPEGPWALTHRAGWQFEASMATQTMEEFFEVKSLAGFDLDPETDSRLIRAAGGLITYLEEIRPAGTDHLRPPRVERVDHFMHLDEMTRRNLELVRPLRDEGGGTLLEVLDHTQTAMGGRLLRKRVLHPLVELEPIERRQQAVQELLKQETVRRELREKLEKVHDLSRLGGKISTERVNPRELLALQNSLEQLPAIAEALGQAQSPRLQTIEEDFDVLEDIRDQIAEAIDSDAPQKITEGGVIQEGYSDKLDQLRRRREKGIQAITELQTSERQKTGINNLKVGHNKVFGYYIEVTKTHQDKVPEDRYHRKQTLKNAERYFTPELKELEETVVEAKEAIEELELELFRQFREQLSNQVHRLQQTSDLVAELDVHACLAEVGHQEDYTRPAVTEDYDIQITEGRHPVVEKTLQREEFIPNDVELTRDGHLMILTGPNMSGKSTVLRQVGLIQLLAQMGGFVPAQQARLGLADRIFTRVGASDNLVRGQSTFMVEMVETATILNSATDRSLVLLDEIGRGTATYDGVSIAWAVTEHIHDKLGARTIFATHYHELVELADRMPGVVAWNVAVRESGDDIIFLRRLEEGGADRSYGVHVAELAGVPQEVTDRARKVLHELETGGSAAGTRLAGLLEDEQQLGLFEAGREPGPSLVEKRVDEIEPEHTTPMEALQLLAELKRLRQDNDKPDSS